MTLYLKTSFCLKWLNNNNNKNNKVWKPFYYPISDGPFKCLIFSINCSLTLGKRPPSLSQQVRLWIFSSDYLSPSNSQPVFKLMYIFSFLCAEVKAKHLSKALASSNPKLITLVNHLLMILSWRCMMHFIWSTLRDLFNLKSANNTLCSPCHYFTLKWIWCVQTGRLP